MERRAAPPVVASGARHLSVGGAAVSPFENLAALAPHHGHVIPRLDGVKAKCGGPALCTECAAEALLVGLPGAKHTSFRAAFDVVKERIRQIMVEGWEAAHDDQHHKGELAKAAGAYAYAAARSDGQREFDGEVPPPSWPWAKHWWKPSTRRRDLVKAAALILAEIERLDRAEARR